MGPGKEGGSEDESNMRSAKGLEVYFRYAALMSPPHSYRRYHSQVFGSNIFGAIAQQGGVKGRNLTFIAGCAVLVAANAAFALTNSHAGMILGKHGGRDATLQ